jgi:hypothetical protein
MEDDLVRVLLWRIADDGLRLPASLGCSVSDQLSEAAELLQASLVLSGDQLTLASATGHDVAPTQSLEGPSLDLTALEVCGLLAGTADDGFRIDFEQAMARPALLSLGARLLAQVGVGLARAVGAGEGLQPSLVP